MTLSRNAFHLWITQHSGESCLLEGVCSGWDSQRSGLKPSPDQLKQKGRFHYSPDPGELAEAKEMLPVPGPLAGGPGPLSASVSTASALLPALFSQTFAAGGRPGRRSPRLLPLFVLTEEEREGGVPSSSWALSHKRHPRQQAGSERDPGTGLPL